jgi:uncharacterized membrane protein
MKHITLLCCLITIANAYGQSVRPTWRIEWLGLLPEGTYTVAKDVSNYGDCVGYGDTNGHTRGWVWKNRILQMLHYGSDDSHSAAECISPEGDVIGGAGMVVIDPVSQYLVGGVPVVWSTQCPVNVFPAPDAFARVGAVYEISSNRLAAVTLGTASVGVGDAYLWRICTNQYERLRTDNRCYFEESVVAPAEVFSTSYDGKVWVGNVKCVSETSTRAYQVGFVLVDRTSIYLLGDRSTDECARLCNQSSAASVAGNGKLVSGVLNQNAGCWRFVNSDWVFEAFPTFAYARPSRSNGIDYHGITVVGSTGSRAVMWEYVNQRWIGFDLTETCRSMGILSNDDSLIAAHGISPNGRYIVGAGWRKVNGVYRLEAFRLDRRIARALPLPIPLE